MNDLKEIPQFIIDRGFEQIPSFSHGKKDLLYKKSNLEFGNSIFLFLEFKPSAKAYSVHVGIADGHSHACLAEVSNTVDQFLDPLMRDSNFAHRPCWCFFDAGRALGWHSGFVVPDPSARDQWMFLMDQLFNEFVDPIFSSIKHENALIKLLLRNDKPFEWAYSASVLRAAEVIALSTIVGMSANEIYDEIFNFSCFIERQISGNFAVSFFVGQLVLEIQKSSNFKIKNRPSNNC